MRFLEGGTGQDLAGEGAGEGIAGSDGVGHLDMRGQQSGGLAVLGDDGAEGRAAGQDGVLQIEAIHEPLAGLFVVALRNGEHLTHHDELVVVDLEDVGVSQQLLDQLLGVEVGAQVDVEELQRALDTASASSSV